MVHLPSDRFHRHTIAQLLGRSVELLIQEWVGYTKLSAVLVIPAIIFNAIYFRHLHKMVLSWVQLMQDQNSSDVEDAQLDALDQILSDFMEAIHVLVWLVLLILLLSTVVKAAMIRTTSQAFVPTPVTTVINLRHGINRLPHMILWGLLFMVGMIAYSIVVGIVVGLVVLVASAIFNPDVGVLLYIALQVGNLFLYYYVTLVLVFCMPLIVVERISAFRTFERAWEMAAGHRCMILCSLLALLLATFVGFALEYILFSGLGWTVLAVVHGLMTLIWMPLGTILITLLYLNVRVDKEGLNVQVLTEELAKGDADIGMTKSSATNTSGLGESLMGNESSDASSSSSYQPISLEDKPISLEEDNNEIV